jgi:hypothetical protein
MLLRNLKGWEMDKIRLKNQARKYYSFLLIRNPENNNCENSKERCDRDMIP